MKTYITFLMITVFVFGSMCFGQEEQNSSFNQFKDLPREKVFVSVNTSMLFTGEYLFYKMYCLDDKTKQPSKNSSIGYVELIDENKEVIFKHKIRLDKSHGQGDFFVPTSVSSGNYKLIAYTNWMRNGSIDLFFQQDISIINPYRSNQDKVLQDSSLKETGYSAVVTTTQAEDKRFLLALDKEQYKQKSKVNIGIQNFRGASGYGDYTISVRKKETLKSSNKHTPESYIEWHGKQAEGKTAYYDEIRFAPELNGELLEGQIVAKNSSVRIGPKTIAVSIPGEDFQLKVIGTDSTGLFYVNLDKEYTQPLALFQVLDENASEYSIEIKEREPVDFSDISFEKFYLTSNMRESIVKRSVYNQIENTYYEAKPDTVRVDQLNDPYDGSFIEIVKLDEFTRFKTLEETIVELVPNVWTKRNKSGINVFKVRSFDDTYEESDYDALVYIDGVFIARPEEVLDFDTRTAKSVNTVREKYRIGGKYYFGMVNIITNEGNYFEQFQRSGITRYQLNGPRITKKYFVQNYRSEEESNIPDFRDQLLWQPTVSFEEKEWGHAFFTSEVVGEYEAVLEGFTIYGRPVFITRSFTVTE